MKRPASKPRPSILSLADFLAVPVVNLRRASVTECHAVSLIGFPIVLVRKPRLAILHREANTHRSTVRAFPAHNQSAFLRALVRLGIADASVLHQFREEQERQAERDEAAHVLHVAREHAKTYGFKITPEQLRAIKQGPVHNRVAKRRKR